MKRILKRLGYVTLLFFFPLGRGRRLDLFGYLLVFVLLFVPLGGWKLFQGESHATQEVREYGATYDVPGFRWARVMNRYGVRTSDTLIRRFENCLLRYRAQVTEITNQATWWSTWQDQVLVEYAPPEGSAATGVLCPAGTIFYLARNELDAFPELFRRRQQYEAELVQEVSDAVEQRRAGPVEQVEDFFTWVEVVNPQGVENFGYEVPLLDACGIEAWGSVQRIGTTSFGDLYEYMPDPQRGFLGIGIPCPANTLFLIDGDRPYSTAAMRRPSA